MVKDISTLFLFSSTQNSLLIAVESKTQSRKLERKEES